MMPLASLRSRTTTCSLMGFAGLQVCFRSERLKIQENSTHRNNITVLWISRGLIHTTSRRETIYKRKQPTTTVVPLLLTIHQVAAMLGLGRVRWLKVDQRV